MSGEAAFHLGDERLTTGQLTQLASRPNPKVTVSDEAWTRLGSFRDHVDRAASSEEKVYGVNTGFGYLSDVAISPEKRQELQVNLIRSHACGTGDPTPDEVVRALLILRAHTFLCGYSGVTTRTVQTLLEFLEHDVLPIIPCKGSVGASGDLAPLAHLALGLMGEGRVRHKGKTRPAGEVLSELGATPLEPQVKEGLSLINGTHYMTAIGAFAVEEAKTLGRCADVTAALSLDAVRGTTAAFDERIQAVRPQAGQRTVASNMMRLFAGADAILESHRDCGKVQDPYSFRCIPQVHGASRDTFAFVASTVDTELNSVTDNPLVMEDGEIISGGNFHGQPVAMAMDFLAIATSELGNISERRIEKITNPHLSGLPPFATRDSGLNSGFMIPHVVAAALVSENKGRCHPASVDSIPTSADKEDHVSMGPIAARKAREINHNLARILGVEALAACQGLDLLAPLKPSPVLDKVRQEIRRFAPTMDRDRSLHEDIDKAAEALINGRILDQLQSDGVHLE